MRAAGYSMATIGACLLLGASVGGELLNPGAPELLTVFGKTGVTTTEQARRVPAAAGVHATRGRRLRRDLGDERVVGADARRADPPSPSLNGTGARRRRDDRTGTPSFSDGGRRVAPRRAASTS